MGKNYLKFLLAGLVIFTIANGCSRFAMVQKKGTPDEKYIAAQRYFNKEDYYRAGILLEELIPLYRGRKESEKIQYYYAYCKYYNRELELAAYFFKSFYNSFPRSEYAEEALYMVGVSKFESTPPYNLDQSYTLEAIAALQNYLSAFPNSDEWVNKSRSYIDDLRTRLEVKNYKNTRIFYKIQKFNSFITAQEVFKKDYPMSAYNEELDFLAIKAYEKVAQNSVKFRMKERYEKTVEKYLDFIDTYPGSQRMQEAENIYIEAKKRIADINKEIEELKMKHRKEQEEKENLDLYGSPDVNMQNND